MHPPAPALLRAVRPDDAPDAALLSRFARERDQPAFAELVRRYGPLVWGVCRRTIGHAQDAEDAFQAVFLVLARRAGNLREPGKLAGFLHGVAVRVGRRARRRTARRREVQVSVPERPTPAAAPSDLSPIIDAELARLPDWYRLPVLLCDVQGLSRAEVADRLGVPEGTISSRLATGRKRLAERLAKRGVVPAVGGLLVAVPAELSAKAVGVAVGWAAGGAVPSAVGALAGGGGRLMRAVLLMTGMGVAIGFGAAAGGPADGPKKPDEPAKPAAVAEKKPEARADAAAVPLGRPKMRSYVDLEHPTRSLVWGQFGRWDGDKPFTGVVVTFDRGVSPKWVHPELIRLTDGGPIEIAPEESITTGGSDRLVGAATVDRDLCLAILRREPGGINAVHQLTIRHLAGQKSFHIPLEAATGEEFRLTTDGRHVLVRLDIKDEEQKLKQSVVQRIDVKTGEPDGAELKVAGGLATVAFSPDGKRVVGVTAQDKVACCWSFPDGKELWTHPLPKTTDRFTAAVSPDGRTVAVAASKDQSEFYQQLGRADVLVKKLKEELGTGVTVFQTADGHAARTFRTTTSESVSSIAFSFDGRLLLIKATGLVPRMEESPSTRMVGFNNRDVIRIYDTLVGGTVQEWPQRAQVAFAPDRYVLAVAEVIAESTSRDAAGNRIETRTGRLGFWHFDPAPAKK